MKPKLRENFEDETWAKLEDAVNAVHAKRPVSYGLEQLYRVGDAQAASRLYRVQIWSAPLQAIVAKRHGMDLGGLGKPSILMQDLQMVHRCSCINIG